MSKPKSLRNVSSDTLRYAAQISVRTGLSMSDVFRLALLSGCLVELTKIAPDADGNYGEIDAQLLARTLRRHLASAIDFLLEHGQHPYQGTFQGRLEAGAATPSPPGHPATEQRKASEAIFDPALGDDLELLGMGFGLSEPLEARTKAAENGTGARDPR